MRNTGASGPFSLAARRAACVLSVCACGVASSSIAGENTGALVARTSESARAVATPESSNPVMSANAILNRWEPLAVEAGAHSPAWREIFATQLTAMDASVLRSIDAVKPYAGDAKASYARFAQAVRAAEMQSFGLAALGKSPTKLGSPTGDQVFVPIVPCRIVDTRNVGGPISAGTTRNFFFYSTGATEDWSGQGGIAGPTGTTCPGTILPNGGVYGPSAAVVTVTVVSPTAAGNWVIWGGASPIPTASALNWTGPGQILANTTVIPFGGRTGSGPGGAIEDFAVKYNGPSGSAQFVADVVGYLVENQATALDCYETPLTSTAVVLFSDQYFATFLAANACAAGWALTSGNCDRDTDTLDLEVDGYSGSFPQAHWNCKFFNRSATEPGNIYASSICCRVPGR